MSIRSSIRGSVKAIEVAGMGLVDVDDIHGGNVHNSSLTGRLGGSIRSLDLFSVQKEDEEADIGERTSLVKGVEGVAKIEHPSILVWIGPALASALSYALYNIFIKKGSYSIHEILGAVILQFVSALLGLISLCSIHIADPAQKLHCDRKGLFWSVCAGISVGLAEILSFTVSGMGTPATHSIPVLIGGSVLFGAVLGVLLLKESLSICHGWSGVFMLVCGIALVSTDPGRGSTGTEVEEETKDAPPLLQWLPVGLFCALMYAVYNICIKLGSASINPILGGVVLQVVAALFGTCVMLGLTIKEGGFEFLFFDKIGIIWSCCAGVAVGMAEILSFVVSGLGTPATQSIPTIIGGSVGFGAVLGLLMLGETLIYQGWGGVVLLLIGIAVVATDPTANLGGH